MLNKSIYTILFEKNSEVCWDGAIIFPKSKQVKPNKKVPKGAFQTKRIQAGEINQRAIDMWTASTASLVHDKRQNWYMNWT